LSQQGLDEALLAPYAQAIPIIAPVERDEEKRNVHRVREYWLEHEAIKHLPALLSLQLPLATFEQHYLSANAHNVKYARGTLRETVRTFFREHTDDSGVRVLTLKLSERPVCQKPSKNILKRWNLSNGMLYFFYAAVGRAAPPTGKEILEPFYCQKRVDFIRRICGGAMAKGGLGGMGEEELGGAKATTEAGVLEGEEIGRDGGVGMKRKAAGGGGRGGGSHDFFAFQEQLHQMGRSRKRRRESNDAPFPLSELYISADTACPPSLPASCEVDGKIVTVKTEDRNEEGKKEEQMIQSLISFLKGHVWKGVEEEAVRAAVAAGTWRLVEEESVDPSLDPSLAYLSRPPRSFWVPSLASLTPLEEGGNGGGEEGREEGVEGWGWENGCLPVFVRACRRNWSRVEAAWEAWNEDLGNNALEWKELWREEVGAEEEGAEEEEGEEEGAKQGRVMEGEEDDLGLGFTLKGGKVEKDVGGMEEEEERFVLFPCGVDGAGTHPEQENPVLADSAAAAYTEGGKEGGEEEREGRGRAGGGSIPLSSMPHGQMNSQPSPTYLRRGLSSSIPSTFSSSLPSSVTPARAFPSASAASVADDFFSVAVKQEEEGEEGGEEGEVISAGVSAATTMEGGEGWGEEGGEEGVMMDFGLDMTDTEFQALLSEVEEEGKGEKQERGEEEARKGGRMGAREGGGCGYMDESFYFAYPGPQATAAGAGGEAVPILSQVSTSAEEGGQYF